MALNVAQFDNLDNHPEAARIYRLLDKHFDLEEVRTLCFILGIEFDSVRGEGKKTRELVLLMERRRRLDELWAEMVKARPFLAGEAVPLAGRPSTPTSGYDYQAERLRDLQSHIRQHLKLLGDYEVLLRTEDDPRRLLRIEREINREKAALDDYRRQAAELGASPEIPPSVPPGKEATTGETADAIRQDLATMGQKLDALSEQMAGAEQRLAAGQAAIRADIAQQQAAILAHVDQRHQATVAAVIERLDANQLEVVELLLDAADRQQIADWQAQELTLLAQQAVVDLRQLREGQPDAGQWDSVLDALQRETTVTQRFLLTIPIVPGILTYESEVNVEAMTALKAAWARLRAKIR